MKVWEIFVVVCIFFNYAAGHSYESSRTCENTTLEITCQSEQIIVIRDAFYGKMPFSENCGNNVTDISSCSYQDAVATVVKICGNKQNCTIFANTNDFPNDTCPSTQKYLTVSYNCVYVPPSLNITCNPKHDYLVANTTTCTDICPGFNCTPQAVSYVCVCNPGYLKDPNTNTCIHSEFCPQGDTQTSHQVYSICANRRQSYCRFHPRVWFPPFGCSEIFSWNIFGCCSAGYVCQSGYFWDGVTDSCVTFDNCSSWFI